MPDHTDVPSGECRRFDEWSLHGSRPEDTSRWEDHLEVCPTCRQQWTTHRLLVELFAGEPLPCLSPAFRAGLDRKLAAGIRIERLSGWRLAAMLSYASAAIALLAWSLDPFPLPRLEVALSSTWALFVGLALVPPSLWLAAACSRLLPPPRSKSPDLLTL
jgi:hypothetical protein